VFVAVVSVTACSKPPSTPPKAEQSAPSPSASTGGAGSTLTVSGRTPAASGGFPSIVIFDPATGGEMPPQTAAPYMDQVQQTFSPPLLFVRTGQPTEFRNNDDVLHNVRVREDETHTPAFNVAIPTGEKYVFSFPRDGFYDVGCDIHPGMSAQIIATSTPYVTLADTDGNFVLENVPPGSYKAVVYAGGKRIERTIDVAAGAINVDLRQ
jgi:plastocyanin